jgi:RND family efflux transporter MFP subunit
MQSFQKVVAPADGVITNRFVDAGNLVAAGGASGTTELLAMAKTDVLRIYVDVPQTDYRYIHSGDKANILLQEFPGQKFVGTVTNISGQLNSNSRTLQTEIQFDNKAHVLKPGAYADVQFLYKNTNPPLLIPSNAAVTKNDGLYVAISADKKVRFQKIDVSRDRGNELEVRQGIKAGQIALLDPPDSLSDGSTVNPVIGAASTQQGEQVPPKAESERGKTSDKDRSAGGDKPAASNKSPTDNK